VQNGLSGERKFKEAVLEDREPYENYFFTQNRTLFVRGILPHRPIIQRAHFFSSAGFRDVGPATSVPERKRQIGTCAIGAVMFGSDQGLVGRFNEEVAEFAMKAIAARKASEGGSSAF
jgi:hypothetical protein